MITQIYGENNNKIYTDYILNKNVIFVAPGSIMTGKGLGSWIDSFDVVVRTNNFPVILCNNKELQKDYGTRTDVLYCNMQYTNKCRPLPAEIWNKLKIKWLCLKKCRDVDYRILRRNHKIRVINKQCQHVAKMLKSPLMGSIIIYDILENCPANLTVTGMDFYNSKGHYKSYPDNYIILDVEKQNTELKIGEGVGHDIKLNAQYIYDYYENGSIELSDFCLVELKKCLTNG